MDEDGREGVAGKLEELHRRLAIHFSALAKSRRAVTRSVFALEHALEPPEYEELSRAVRAFTQASRRPHSEHWLPWVVYAAEVGYGFAGGEYWQTFEHETEGWSGDSDRQWMRAAFLKFREQFAGAEPGGDWARHFSIICWPLAHAVLPRDLQRQLAKILYELRHSFTDELLASPAALGARVRARSWSSTSRFRHLAEQETLVGQIAAALLLGGGGDDDSWLLPSTLKRIGADLERERQAREWLRDARRAAQDRSRLRGLAPRTHATARAGTATPRDTARREVVALGLEPALVLRPTAGVASWDVMLEIPDLTPLLARFPEAAVVLATSRCVVAGSSGRPLARGRLLHGAQQVPLKSWPRDDEVLLHFEGAPPSLEYLLRTECLLRPGPSWIFRVASDGQAREIRTARVRAGQRYVLLRTDEAPHVATLGRSLQLSCTGAFAAELALPAALAQHDVRRLRDLGVDEAATLSVWPAGLAAAKWDGEGHAEWLSTDTPRIGVRADHDIVGLAAALDDATPLRVGAVSAGTTVFLELPRLQTGQHLLVLDADLAGDAESQHGELQITVRDPLPWDVAIERVAAFGVELNPPRPTLEQLWQGELEVTARGPQGRRVVPALRFVGDVEEKRLPPLELPVAPATFRSHLQRHFREQSDVAAAYDRARACLVTIDADDLGRAEFLCERESSPLRWAHVRGARAHELELIDSTAEGRVQLTRYPFEKPDTPFTLNNFDGIAEGGMYVARKHDFLAAIIVPPTGHGLRDLGCVPRVASVASSADGVQKLLQLAALWAEARVSGDLLSSNNQRLVVRALTRKVFSVFGGTGWERVESATKDVADLQELKRAVAKTPDERAFAAKLMADYPEYRAMSCDDRAERFAALTTRVFRLAEHDSGSTRTAGGALVRRGARKDPQSLRWLAELALRMASDIRAASAFAGEHLGNGTTRLLRHSVLARGARFLVIAIDRAEAASTQSRGAVHAGWHWT